MTRAPISLPAGPLSRPTVRYTTPHTPQRCITIPTRNFDFEFAQFDQLEFNDETIDNQLTALFAYYAYLIIGIDLDSFSPMGGEDVLKQCMNLTNNAQNLNFTGWKAFDDSRNRFAIINDYLDGAMQPFRQLQYDYYRNGLDEMANNVERGRTNITGTGERPKEMS